MMLDIDPKDVQITFGKYKGKTIQWIGQEDILYLDWLNGIKQNSPTLSVAIEAECNTLHTEITIAIQKREDEREQWSDPR